MKSKAKARKTAANPVPASAPAVLSFLKETSAAPPWTAKDLARVLNISPAEAESAAAILEISGYAERAAQAGRWRTTAQADSVSGGKEPRLTRASADKAVAVLLERVRAMNADPRAPYRVSRVVAFGDYVSGRERLQPVEIGLELEKRSHDADAESAVEHKSEAEVIKTLRSRSPAIHLHLLEPWMTQRTHRVLL